MIWVNRNKETLDSSPEEADRGGQDPPRGGEAARRRVGREGRRAASRRRRRHVALLADDVHARAVRRGGVLRRLAGAAGRARAAAGGRRAGRLPRRRLRSRRTPTGTTCSAATRSRTRRSALAESSAARLRNEPGAAQRELREFDEEHYVERPGAADAAGRRRRCRCRGTAAIGERELELHPADGHTVDGMAILVPWASVLSAATTSRRSRSRGSRGRVGVAPTSRRWRGSSRWSSASSTSCPGTARCSTPSARSRSCARTAPTSQALLEHGADAPLPLTRRTGALRKIHAENVERRRRRYSGALITARVSPARDGGALGDRELGDRRPPCGR